MVEEVPVEVTVRTERAVRSLQRVTAAWTAFRNNLAKSDRVFNATINSAAILFRSLARLRTAFFILVTFLAVRPVVRFFKSLEDDSVAVQRAFFALEERFNVLKRIVGDALAPAITFLGNQLLDLFEDLLAFVTKPEFVDFAAFLIRFFDKALKVLTVFFNTAQIQIRAIGTTINFLQAGIEALLLLLAQGLRELDAGFKIVNDSFLRWLRFVNPAAAAAFLLNDALNATGTSLEDVAKGIEDLVGKDFETIWNGVTEEFREFDKLTQENIKNIVASTKALLENADSTEEFIRIVQAAAEKLRDFRNALEEVGSVGARVIEGLKRGFDSFAQRTVEKIAETLARGVAQAFEDNLGDAFLQIMEGKLDKLEDIITNFLKDVQRALAKFAAQQFTTGLLTQLGFGGGGQSALKTGLGVVGNILSGIFTGGTGIQPNQPTPDFGEGIVGGGRTGLTGGVIPAGGVSPTQGTNIFDSDIFIDRSGTGQGPKGIDNRPRSIDPSGNILDSNIFERRQHGGLFSGPAIVGEGPGIEAAVPLRRGKIPVDLRGGGRQGPVIHFNITAMDDRSVANWLQRPASQAQVIGIISKGMLGGSADLRFATNQAASR